MNRNLTYAFILCSFFLLTLPGCTRSGNSGRAGAEKGKDGETSAPLHGTNASANDPRWRNELFQNSVEAIRDRASYENPEQYLNALNQVAARFNGWIQTRPAIEGWKTDPLASAVISRLDELETLRKSVNSTFFLFRNAQDGAEFSPEQAQTLSQLAEALKNIAERFSAPPSEGENLPESLRFLARNFQAFRERILTQLTLKRVDADLKMSLQGFHLFFEQIGILIGSQRLEFLPAAASNIPTAPGEMFSMAYENDVYPLFEQFLLQDVSRWAQGTVSTELEEIRIETQSLSDTTGVQNRVAVAAEDSERMNAIFEWTVANIDLRPTLPHSPEHPYGTSPQLPLEVLFSGEGTVLERAWLCILLARQQELNAFLIEIPAAEGTVRPLIGFLYNDDISLYDPEMGLQVFVQKTDAEAETRKSLWEKGRLRVKPALWSEICANPEILNDFWTLAGLPKVSDAAESVKKARVLLEASPWYLTMRMALLQDALKNGENRVVMSLPPVETLPDGTVSEEMLFGAHNAPASVRSQILRKNTFSSVEVWQWPVDAVIYRALDPNSEMNRLRLFQKFCTAFPDGNFNLWRGRMLYLKGILTGPMSAAGYYQKARLSESMLEENYAKGGPQAIDFYRECRCDASFYLSLISFMLERTDAALDSYERHVLNTGFEKFRDSARYHCGRMCELKEDWEAARKFYSEVQGPLKTQANARAALLP